MMKKPFISVIIPAYNEEKYIEPTLKAVKNQDYEGKYEIIVADGKSKDKTVKIATRYADKVIITKKKGIGLQQNEATKIARGDIFLFLQADTILPSDAISKMSNYLNIHKDVVFGNLSFTYEEVNLNTKILSKIMRVYWNLNKYVTLGWSGGPTLFISRHAFKKVNGFKNVILEDIDIGLRLIKIGKGAVIPDIDAISSSRRFKKEGYSNVILLWIKQLFLILLNKPKRIHEYQVAR